MRYYNMATGQLLSPEEKELYLQAVTPMEIIAPLMAAEFKKNDALREAIKDARRRGADPAIVADRIEREFKPMIDAALKRLERWKRSPAGRRARRASEELHRRGIRVLERGTRRGR